MKKIIYAIAAIVLTFTMVACSTSKGTTTVSKGSDLPQYKHLVFAQYDTRDVALAELLQTVQNQIAEKFEVITSDEAVALMRKGEKVLTPHINIKSDSWAGGRTYVTITFHDQRTDESVAVIKSIGLDHNLSPKDQKRALKALKKQLDKTFK